MIYLLPAVRSSTCRPFFCAEHGRGSFGGALAKRTVSCDNEALGVGTELAATGVCLLKRCLMGAILDALHRLQRIERDLNSFRAKEESIRRNTRNFRRQISKSDATCITHREAVTKCQMEIDNADLDIKAREESMSRHRQALNVAKSNKEYAAILTALNTEKAGTSKCESRVLELMARKEQLQDKSKEFEEDRVRLEARLRKYEQQLATYLEETREASERLQQEREEAARELPASALETFSRVAGRLEGEALAELEKLSSRREDYVCGGCNMSVPLELVNRLRSRDELLLCGTCGRILYLNESSVRSA